ncbi:hypothetical protein RVIR1_09380 [Candidatus Rickettsiella viridis]|uniref:Uncharacterized protein n=1 Tax=Candidatus Rickettsiella viridis TaxID=676208 RepID=A0A2Z5V7J1_9COXI|nr:hypothetical protein [Candidatus Rickettsiella viridis]BBB15417.1 hypothetical protein RVIR1_09380 [Candidatus Rickettsiella viridis]
MSKDKTQKALAERYRKPEEFISAVDKIIESNKQFAEQVRNGTFSSETAVKGTPRLYMTQMQELAKFQQFSKDKKSPKIQYALTISALANQRGLLQPPSTPDIHLKDLPISAIATRNHQSPIDFWNRYNPLSAENKAKVDERLLAVLDLQATAFKALRFYLDIDHAPLQKQALMQGKDAMEWRMKHINSNQISLEKACDGLKELTAEKKTHVEHLSKMSAEAKVLYPSKTELFTSSLSQVRHKMSSAVKEVSSTVKAMTYSAHSFFAKKSPASTKPTFVSYISRLEEETSKPEKESSPTLLALSR